MVAARAARRTLRSPACPRPDVGRCVSDPDAPASRPLPRRSCTCAISGAPLARILPPAAYRRIRNPQDISAEIPHSQQVSMTAMSDASRAGARRRRRPRGRITTEQRSPLFPGRAQNSLNHAIQSSLLDRPSSSSSSSSVVGWIEAAHPTEGASGGCSRPAWWHTMRHGEVDVHGPGDRVERADGLRRRWRRRRRPNGHGFCRRYVSAGDLELTAAKRRRDLDRDTRTRRQAPRRRGPRRVRHRRIAVLPGRHDHRGQ